MEYLFSQRKNSPVSSDLKPPLFLQDVSNNICKSPFFWCFSGVPTNVSCQLFVASLSSINTENMVRCFSFVKNDTALMYSTLWQYRLSRFQAGGTKLERFLPNNQHTTRKLLNFENCCNGEVSKSIFYVKNHRNLSQFFFIEEYQFKSKFLVIDIF